MILASFKASFWYAFLASVTLVLGAAYTLWLVKRVVFGPVGNDHVAQLQDLNGREFLVLGVLAARRARAGPVARAAARRDAADARATRAADDGDEALTMNPASITRLDLMLAAPEIFMLAAICVVLLVDLFLTERTRWVTFVLSLLTLAGASWITAVTGVGERTVAGTARTSPTRSATLLKIVAYGAVAVAFLYGYGYLRTREILKGEYFVLGLFALLGIMVLVSANSLVTMYLGVELLALSQYAMVAFHRDSGIAAESAIKYFVLGSIASGALLYGMSIIYGVTGSLELGVVSANGGAACGPNQIGLLFGLAFLVVGIAFKFGAVPFHMWVPDVYHGAPTLGDVVPRRGAEARAHFALAFRLLAEGLGPMHATGWQDMITIVAVLSIVDRQRRRDRADEPQAHAGVFDDLARRLHPARHPDGHERRLRGGAVLHDHVRDHGDRRLRHDHPAVARGLRGRQPRGLQGPERAQPVVRGRDADADVQHGRRAAIRRFLREAGRDPGRVEHRRASGSPSSRSLFSVDRRVLLPARREADVFRRAGRTARRCRAAASMRFVLSVNGLAVLVLGLFPGVAAGALRAGHSLSAEGRRPR